MTSEVAEADAARGVVLLAAAHAVVSRLVAVITT